MKKLKKLFKKMAIGLSLLIGISILASPVFFVKKETKTFPNKIYSIVASDKAKSEYKLKRYKIKQKETKIFGYSVRSNIVIKAEKEHSYKLFEVAQIALELRLEADRDTNIYLNYDERRKAA